MARRSLPVLRAADPQPLNQPLVKTRVHLGLESASCLHAHLYELTPANTSNDGGNSSSNGIVRTAMVNVDEATGTR